MDLQTHVTDGDGMLNASSATVFQLHARLDRVRYSGGQSHDQRRGPPPCGGGSATIPDAAQRSTNHVPPTRPGKDAVGPQRARHELTLARTSGPWVCAVWHQTQCLEHLQQHPRNGRSF